MSYDHRGFRSFSSGPGFPLPVLGQLLGPMPLTRLVIFVPDTVVSEYDSLADTVVGSQSELMRWALERALPHVRDHVLSVATAGVAPHSSVSVPSGLAVSRPRRRGRPVYSALKRLWRSHLRRATGCSPTAVSVGSFCVLSLGCGVGGGVWRPQPQGTASCPPLPPVRSDPRSRGRGPSLCDVWSRGRPTLWLFRSSLISPRVHSSRARGTRSRDAWRRGRPALWLFRSSLISPRVHSSRARGTRSRDAWRRGRPALWLVPQRLISPRVHSSRARGTRSRDAWRRGRPALWLVPQQAHLAASAQLASSRDSFTRRVASRSSCSVAVPQQAHLAASAQLASSRDSFTRRVAARSSCSVAVPQQPHLAASAQLASSRDSFTRCVAARSSCSVASSATGSSRRGCTVFNANAAALARGTTGKFTA